MRVLFVHNNFPAQFRHIAQSLAQTNGVQVAAIGSATARPVAGVRLERYQTPVASAHAHAFARRFDVECRRAEQVMYIAAKLQADGFEPDLIVAHSGWGETIPLREMFPKARIVVYCEYFYRSRGLDVGFDAEFPDYGVDGMVGLNARNATQLLALADADAGLSPTEWQRSTYPAEFRDKIMVIHEGVDTTVAVPNADAAFRLGSGRLLTRADEVVTYVTRAFEPLRGFHVFMRALPELQRARPNAETVIVGGDGAPYGQRPPGDRTWKDVFLSEVRHKLDMSRVHFVGHQSYDSYISLLQISRAHVYLTYPFVASWSLLEAMSAGCTVVASDTPPVREIVREGEGVLVPFFDAPRLAREIADLLQDTSRAAQLAAAARQRVVQDYDMATVCSPRAISSLTAL